MDKLKISTFSLGILACAASLIAASNSEADLPMDGASPETTLPAPDSIVEKESSPEVVPYNSEEVVEAGPPQIIPIGGYLRPEEIAVPPKIPGYRLYQIDRNVKVAGVLDGGGTFDAILPVYVYYPNSKTLNLNNELKRAIDSMGVINAEISTLKQYGDGGSRRLNDSLAELTSTLNTLQVIAEEEIKGFQR